MVSVRNGTGAYIPRPRYIDHRGEYRTTPYMNIHDVMSINSRHLVDVLKGVEDIVRQAREQVHHEPALEVVGAYDLRVGNYLTARSDEGRVSVNGLAEYSTVLVLRAVRNSVTRRRLYWDKTNEGRVEIEDDVDKEDDVDDAVDDQ